MLLTRHAVEQARSRGLTTDDLSLVLRYGRSCHVRGAEIHFVGRREAKHHMNVPRLASVEGVHVVCATDSGAVITAYRNHRAPRMSRSPFRIAAASTDPQAEGRS